MKYAKLLVLTCLALAGISNASAQRGSDASALSAATSSPAHETTKDFRVLTDPTLHEEALRVIAAHIASNGKPWTGLRINGTVVLADAQPPAPAELLLQNLNQAILKIDRSEGLTGIAVEGAFRRSFYADGTSMVDPAPAGAAGLLPLQLLHTPDFIDRILSAKVVAATSVDGIPCDKISTRFSLSKVRPAKNSSPHNLQVDFYLDSKSHLLVQSVSSVSIPGLSNSQLQVTRYQSYKQFNGVQFPQRITQTIGGMPLWDFSVTTVDQESKIELREFTK